MVYRNNTDWCIWHTYLKNRNPQWTASGRVRFNVSVHAHHHSFAPINDISCVGRMCDWCKFTSFATEFNKRAFYKISAARETRNYKEVNDFILYKYLWGGVYLKDMYVSEGVCFDTRFISSTTPTAKKNYFKYRKKYIKT